MANRKSTTNYSKAEITRRMKKDLERKVTLARNVKKGKESFTKFPKATKVKTSTKTTKSNRSSAQLRAIFAKKK
jgi:formiminotetrahydrofolate cyclodeaminase